MSEKSLSLVHRASNDPTRVQRLGPYAIETLIAPAEEGRTTVYRVTIAAHETTRVSYHKLAEEFYFVIAGRGTALLDGKPYELKTGDLLRLPPGTTHGFVTTDEPLDLLNFHTPGCRPDHDVYFADGPAPHGFMSDEPRKLDRIETP